MRVHQKKAGIRFLLSCLFLTLALSVCPECMPSHPVMLTAQAKTKKKKASTLKTGLVKKNGKWYFLDKSGKRVTGWIHENGKIYYASKSGRLFRGWNKIGGHEYYFRTSGKKNVICSALTGKGRKVNGIACNFSADGVFLACKYAGSRSTFVKRIGEMARDNQRKTGLNAGLTAAQACLESAGGSSSMARSAHNLFGLRGGTYYGYKRFDSDEACLEYYTLFMRRYFPSVFRIRDAASCCSIVGNGGYAEAGGYASALISVLRMNNLARFSR